MKGYKKNDYKVYWLIITTIDGSNLWTKSKIASRKKEINKG